MGWVVRRGNGNGEGTFICWDFEMVSQGAHQLMQLAPVASHPALLPTLVYTYVRSLLQRLINKEFDNLYRVEAESGQTFVTIFDELGPVPLGNSSHENTSKKALGIIQLVTAWEGYTKGLLFEIDSLQQFIRRLVVSNITRLTESGSLHEKGPSAVELGTLVYSAFDLFPVAGAGPSSSRLPETLTKPSMASSQPESYHGQHE